MVGKMKGGIILSYYPATLMLVFSVETQSKRVSCLKILPDYLGASLKDKLVASNKS